MTVIADHPPGFMPGETVQLQVLNLTDPADTGSKHDAWQVTNGFDGNFQTTLSVTADELGMTLQLTAKGLTSGLTAQTTFTDGSDTWIGGRPAPRTTGTRPPTGRVACPATAMM